ncbi:hypothetical protein LEP1GSC193_3886 [Leptospira alstonii serovar Pingchang str. 80-412]|uniref:Uncharacterized protein n=2 Tax=Leptospira alstonii TaxID=28452 RepID=M6CSM3_9LEPT|nr:hypothetical protein LEP1GSC194_4167 [Leptospira alstonii serovar Sichuan str. 79601]EQA82330.1 hypothetical protein LEP1GSC193_3886 [Leptospira alstonii serovar Pingchang str. 80-412]
MSKVLKRARISLKIESGSVPKKKIESDIYSLFVMYYP